MNILAGDIGGTKTLLAVFDYKQNIEKLYQKKYISNAWSSLEEIIIDFMKTIPSNISHPKQACIAVAGPVNNGKSKVTNLPWFIEEENIRCSAKLNKVILINDFSVLIHGIPHLKKEQYVEIQASNNNSSREDIFTIVGAGTGLGVARGITTKDGLIAIPSEAGHCEFSPRTDAEWELSNWLKKDLNISRLSVERVVSGTGLGHLAKWRLSKKDAFKHPLREIAFNNSKKNAIHSDFPALVSKYALNGDFIMKEVISIWLEAYGSAVGDIALHDLCNKGLWIGGGTASKQLTGIRSKKFLNAMSNKGRFKPFLENLPIRAIIDPEVGLFSSACKAFDLYRQDGKLK